MCGGIVSIIMLYACCILILLSVSATLISICNKLRLVFAVVCVVLLFI